MASTALLSTLNKQDARTLATVARAQFPDMVPGALATSIQDGAVWRYKFEPMRSCYYLVNITGRSVRQLTLTFDRVGVTEPAKIKAGRVTREAYNITKARLDERFGTAKAIEKDDSDSDEEESAYKYEKDQPAGEILKFVVNKYLELYFPAGGRVA